MPTNQNILMFMVHSVSFCLLFCFEPIYRDLQDLLADKWASLRGRTVSDCVRIYLTCTRKWALFGATLFQARLRPPPPPDAPPQLETGAPLWLAAAEDGISLLELGSMAPIAKYLYSQVVTFGGCQDDFMLVIGTDEAASQKLLFALSKPKVHRFIHLSMLKNIVYSSLSPLPPFLPPSPSFGIQTIN